MTRMTFRPLPALALLLILGSAPLAGEQPGSPELAQRVAVARGRLLAQRATLGLDTHASFQPRPAFVNAQGRTVARFQQTHDGLRVWGGNALVHVEADGTTRTLTQGVMPGIALASATPRLDAARAQAIVLKDLAAKGTPQVQVEPIVFPTRFTGGLATRRDAKRGVTQVDFSASVWAKPSAEPYVRAYEVRTLLANRQDGHREMTYVVDADSGAILRKWNAIQPLRAADDTPAQGTGQSWFRGTVPLSTAQAGDGTFSLVAKDRGTQPQPYFQSQGITQVGLTTCYGMVDLTQGLLGFEPYTGRAGNAWGDGTLTPLALDPVTGAILDLNGDGSLGWLQGARTATGETTAVDAHYGLSTTWDFYRNVFGREGIDGLGTSTFAIVHPIEPSWWYGMAPMIDNAYWAPWYFGMVFGEGGYPADPVWGIFKATTELDIAGHELTHGVTQETAGLIYEGQSGGLNEATSDILGKMVQAYADGGATGAVIPDFAPGDLGAWEVGRNAVVGHPLRAMYRPSLDGISADAWYDGIDSLDVHFSSGPVNRFFFFLATGASADATSDRYSPYLPGGMTGLGNDKAARIWYKALTEYLVADADFVAARTATLAAAQELYGQAAADAVARAWAAVNVGEAPGQAPRVRIRFPEVHPAGSFLGDNAVPTGVLGRTQILPIRTTVRLQTTVENTPDHGVVLNFDDPRLGHQAGTLGPDGTWTTPNFSFYSDLLPLVARAHADLNQFAKASMLLADLDGDMDTEQDALDLGLTAMVWGCPNAPQASARTAGMGNDWDLVFFTEAFHNAWLPR